MTDLASLLARVEAATGPDRELDCDIAVSLGLVERLVGKYRTAYRRHDPDGSVTGDEDVMVRRFTASVDAALALAERVLLPHGPITILIAGSGQAFIDSNDACGLTIGCEYAATPALALCAAILKAKLANNASQEIKGVGRG